jgi:hypothetical protein
MYYFAGWFRSSSHRLIRRKRREVLVRKTGEKSACGQFTKVVLIIELMYV